MTKGENRPRVPMWQLAIGLFLAYLPTYSGPLARLVGLDLSGWGPPAAMVWNGLAVGLLLAHVFVVERLDWSSLRLVRPTEQDLTWAGWLGGAAVLWHWIAATWLVPLTQDQAGNPTMMSLGPLVAVLLVITTVLTEEVLWRGYVVERLAAWTGAVVASVLGLAVFAAGHVPFFGWTWLVTGLPGAALLYVLLLWRRNLWACILAHFIGNVPVAIVAFLR